MMGSRAIADIQGVAVVAVRQVAHLEGLPAHGDIDEAEGAVGIRDLLELRAGDADARIAHRHAVGVGDDATRHRRGRRRHQHEVVPGDPGSDDAEIRDGAGPAAEHGPGEEPHIGGRLAKAELAVGARHGALAVHFADDVVPEEHDATAGLPLAVLLHHAHQHG
ncbi:MAG: hypothetical protein P8099_06480 [Gemmatimonadota bacterium]